MSKSNSTSTDFIKFDTFRKEGYWNVTEDRIKLFNEDVKSKGGLKQHFRENAVAAAQEYGDRVFFLGQPEQIWETTKILAISLATRSRMYYMKNLREEIEKFFLPEIEVTINNLTFLIIPCITLWGRRAHPRTNQFVTINLIFLSTVRNGDYSCRKIAEFMARLSRPQFYGVQIKVKERQIFFNLENKEYSFSNFLNKLVRKTCSLLTTQTKECGFEDKFSSMMTSVILDFNLYNKICSIPDFSLQENFNSDEEILATALYDILYGFWKYDKFVGGEDLSHILSRMEHDQISYAPKDASVFFNESKLLSLSLALSEEFFPDFSCIWLLGVEVLANENSVANSN